MRKLIVNNFVTVDGYYEAKDKTIDGFFEYYHDDYAGDQNFDNYAAERLRARKDSELGRYATATAYEGFADAKLGRAAESMTAFDEALRYASDDAKTWNLYSTAMQSARGTLSRSPMPGIVSTSASISLSLSRPFSARGTAS